MRYERRTRRRWLRVSRRFIGPIATTRLRKRCKACRRGGRLKAKPIRRYLYTTLSGFE